jgi:predicted DNA-binding transcriptional regulator AlpA
MEQINTMTKRLLSADEAARYLGISVKTLYNQTGPKAKKRLPVKVKRVGKLLKFDIRELDAFIDSL